MKKGYRACPYCANEIKENAKKCQFCHEFVEIDGDDLDSKEDKKVAIKRHETNVRVKKRVWILAIIAILFASFLIYGRRYARNHYFDSNFPSSNSDSQFGIDNPNFDYDSDERQVLFKFNELNDKYGENKRSLGKLYVEDANDYKNVDTIDNYIYNWKLYKKYTQDYYSGVNELKWKYMDMNDDEKELLNVTSKLLYQVLKLSDANTEFLSYIKTIQDEFFVSEDGNVTFYSENEAYNKYLILVSKFSEEANKYNNTYYDYMDFLDRMYKKYPEYSNNNQDLQVENSVNSLKSKPLKDSLKDYINLDK